MSDVDRADVGLGERAFALVVRDAQLTSSTIITFGAFSRHRGRTPRVELLHNAYINADDLSKDHALMQGIALRTRCSAGNDDSEEHPPDRAPHQQSVVMGRIYSPQ